MKESAPSPQINVSKIQGSGGIAGAMFAVISTVIFLIGIPVLRYLKFHAFVHYNQRVPKVLVVCANACI